MSKRVHLVGIGGAGMSAIARVLHERGDLVTGSDRTMSPYARALEAAGVQVVLGHAGENVAGAELVIATSAVPDTNIELQTARELGIPVLRRNQFLPQLMQGRREVAVAGTHGKTTTSGMIAWILDQSGLAPGFIVGGMLGNFGSNARLGLGKAFVIEADEYDRAFLGLSPDIAVITNLEHDHPDCYPTFEDVRGAFRTFVEQVQDLLIVCLDDPGAASMRRDGLARLTYGLTPEADWYAEEIRPNAAGGMDFLVLRRGKLLGLARNRLPGEHNVRNSLAGLAVADSMGVSFSEARKALTEYSGAGRRFEVIGEARGIVVIDDYAHHPTEIKATLAATKTRYPQSQIWAIFQPHTYSRIKTLRAAYTNAFEDADHVLVTDIFAARETPDEKVTGDWLAGQLEHDDARHVADYADLVELLLQEVPRDSVVVILSAGDANQVAREYLSVLGKHEEG